MDGWNMFESNQNQHTNTKYECKLAGRTCAKTSDSMKDLFVVHRSLSLLPLSRHNFVAEFSQ